MHVVAMTGSPRGRETPVLVAGGGPAGLAAAAELASRGVPCACILRGRFRSARDELIR